MRAAEWRRERIFGAGMCVLSSALAIQAFRYPAESAHFPRFLSVLLLLLSILLVIRGVRAPRPERPTPEEHTPRFSVAESLRSPAAFVFGASAIYLVTMQWLGFLASSILFMAACAGWLGHRRWPTGLVWGVAFPLGLYALFHGVLGLALPMGWLR
jgi:hypothetical protein